jgi:hypothetical protein
MSDERVIWRHADGTLIACDEKLKVLNENLSELRQLCRDAFEDALLIGCDEAQVRAEFTAVVQSLQNPFAKP